MGSTDYEIALKAKRVVECIRMENLSDLLKLHIQLDGMFSEHQHALLHFEFEKAAAALRRYEAALLIHMSDEEEVLLPIYREYGDLPKGGDAKIFSDEHEKMLGYVKMFAQETAKLAAVKEPENRLLMLLDREAFYKRLSGHHDKREHDILYPILDERTSPAKKAELLGRVTRGFENLPALSAFG